MKCKKCGKEILFLKMKSGAFEPCENFRKIIITLDGQAVEGHEPHWGNCTDPDHFRKKKPNKDFEKPVKDSDKAV